MTLPFTVHKPAELELNEAADFYDIGDPGPGGMPINELERAVATVRKHKPRVLAVAHQKRRPFCRRAVADVGPTRGSSGRPERPSSTTGTPAAAHPQRVRTTTAGAPSGCRPRAYDEVNGPMIER